MKFFKITVVFSLLLLSFPALASDTEDIARFKMAYPGAQVLQSPVSDAPSFLYDFKAASPANLSPEMQARHFIDRNKQLLGVRDAARELSLEKSLQLRGNSVQRFSQTYKDIPVWQGGINVVSDFDGQVIRVYNQFVSVKDLDTKPVITAEEAIIEAWARVYGAPTYTLGEKELNAKQTKLFIWSRAGHVRLAFAVGLPHPLLTEKRIAFIDAHNGEFLMQFNQVVFERMANVWEYNPGKDGDLATVERQLGEILPDQGYTVGLLHEAFNCPDEGDTITINFGVDITVPMCTEKHLAEAGDDGDFLYEPAMYGYGDPRSHNDEFAEVHMFYHVGLIYEQFIALGLHIDSENPPFETLNEVPLTCVSNFKMPDIGAVMGGGEVGLVAFDNAFYVPKDGLIPGEYPEKDSIVFGQGTLGDLSYDGEVVFHEFTHAVVDSTVQLGSLIVDRYGLAVDPGAANEGYSDYFSATLAGDPKMGEFSGYIFGGLTGNPDDAALRELDNDKLCPNDVHGEVHDDSEWWSAALWELRQEYKVSDDDHLDVDAAIFAALLELPSEASYTIMANTTARVMGEWFDADAKAFADEVFERRGLIDCDRAIPVENGTVISMLQLYDSGSVNMRPFVPGLAQFHADLADGVRSVIVEFKVRGGGGIPGIGGGSDVVLDVLARKGQAVTFTYGRDVSADYDFLVSFSKQQSENGVDVYEAVITPEDGEPFAAGDWYFALANKSSGGGMFGGGTMMQAISFTYGCTNDEDCGKCNVCGNDGLCAPVESECKDDADCSGLEVCVASLDGCAGVCEVPDNACVTGLDCEPCQICTDGLCLDLSFECEEDDDCDDDQICELDPSECGGSCVDSDVAPDGDLAADGDEADGDDGGSGGSGASSGCSQSNSSSALFILLAGMMLALARRRKQSV